MAEDGVQRRLAAIVSADVVSYTRLIEADDAGTRSALNVHREELIDPSIAEHHGRTVSTAGDSFLVEFASVVDAVRCAMAFQRGMAERNTTVAEDRRIVFRIGISLGDVIVEGNDIHGDGVNVAARLQALAAPGSICISAKVFEEVQNRIEVGFEDLGEIEVKNVTRPVRVFRVAPELVEGTIGGPSVARAPKRHSEPATESQRLGRDLRVSGLIMLPMAPGLALFGWLLSLQTPAALLPLVGAGALVAFVGIGLLVASKVTGRPYRDDEPAPNEPKA